MNRLVLIHPGQQIVSLALAALLTSSVLLSLGAQADHRYADAQQMAQTAIAQQHSAASAQPSGS